VTAPARVARGPQAVAGTPSPPRRVTGRQERAGAGRWGGPGDGGARFVHGVTVPARADLSPPRAPLVLTLVVVALVVLGGLALQQRERMAKWEKQIEVEQRRREHLGLLVERLQEPAAGIEPELGAPMVGVVIHVVGKPGLKH
jgi:hypothetical protein